MQSTFKSFTLPQDKFAPKNADGFQPVSNALAQKYEQQNAEKPVDPNNPAEVLKKNPLDLKARLQQIYGEAKDNISKTQDQFNKGEINGGTTGLKNVGSVVKAIGRTATIPFAMGIDELGKMITAGRDAQKERDQAAIDAGTLKPEDALSNKPHLEDQIAELIGKGLTSEQGQHLRAYYDSLSPSAKGNIKGITDLLSGGFDIATLGIGKKVIEGGAKAVTEKVAKNEAEKLAKMSEKKIATAIENATPKVENISGAEYENMLNNGKITPRTTTSPATYVMSDEEKKIATKYADLLQEKDPVNNINSIRKEIINKDKQVEQFLKDNNKNYIFNDGELRNYIKNSMSDLTDVTIPEARLNKLKDQLATNFVKSVETNNVEGVWRARKLFDSKIDSAFKGSPTLQKKKEAKIKLRNSVQDYIAEHTPDTTYKGYMKDMSELYKLRDTLNSQAVKEKSLSGNIEAWIRDNPKKAKALGWTAGSVGAGALYNYLVD